MAKAAEAGESQLRFAWDAKAIKDSGGDKDHGIRFCVEHDPDANDGAGGQVLAVAHVPKALEIVYKDRKFGMECTHLVVPGMVVEKIQNRDLSLISFDMQAVAKYINDYRFKTDGPLTLHFREEVVGGESKGFPYVIEIAEHNAKLYQAQARRGRRGSILGKKGGEVDQEVKMAQHHARRMSIDVRSMSSSGASAADIAAAATAAHAKSMRVGGVGEEEVRGGSRRGSDSRSSVGGRRGSVSSMSMEDAARAAAQASGASGTPRAGGRRGSVSSMSMEDAARSAAQASGASSTPRAGGRRGSVSSNSSHGGRRGSVPSQGSEDRTAGARLSHSTLSQSFPSCKPDASSLRTELEAGGMLSGSAHAVSFKSQGDGVRGEKLQLQVGRHTVALYEKSGQPHSHYAFKQFAQQTCVRTNEKGFTIRLATGRELLFKAKPKEAAQIAQEVTLSKLTWDEIQREGEEEEAEAEAEAEEEPPAEAHADLIKLGARVMISGLVSEAGQPFNGMLGTVHRELDESSGRLGVMLDSG